MKKSELAIAAFLAAAKTKGGPALRAAAAPKPPKKRLILQPLRRPGEGLVDHAKRSEIAQWNEQVEFKKEARQQRRAEREASK